MSAWSMPSSRSERRATRRPAWRNTALVIGLSVALGVLVLPRLRPGLARSVGQEAPDFALPVIHGGEAGSRIRLSDLRGRIVLLEFWASWCPGCRQQAPILDAFARRTRAEDVLVVGIATGDEPPAALDYARSRALGYPVVVDETQSVATAYDASTLPWLVVVDRAGRVAAVRSGVVAAEQLERLVKEASQDD